MRCKVLHDIPGRLRVRLYTKKMSLAEADIIEYYLRNSKTVTDVKVYDRTKDVVIFYNGEKEDLKNLLANFSFDDEKAIALVPDRTGREISRKYENKLINAIILRIINKALLPCPVRIAATIIRSFKYLKEGIKVLIKGRIEVPVLDATAIAVSMIRGDFKTAGTVMFLLKIGDILQEWTHKKSIHDLVKTMSLNIDKVWVKASGKEFPAKIDDVSEGDIIVVRTGGMIPLDGEVIYGEALVNQASITGESMPVMKKIGSHVYAGTVLEEGECNISVTNIFGSGRYDRVVAMIEESEKLKSTTEDKASHMADKLVPYTLIGTFVTYLLTGNTQKALAILMVDFSCALKLSMPITVLSAMREAGSRGITVKGGKFLEAVADADTIVFDKTGTLTHAEPKVKGVVTFGGSDETESLRLAACLEEHYPHSIANAVVREAQRRNLKHEEKHSKVEYIVAHGISSQIDSVRAVIGSYHFVFQDEKSVIPDGEEEKFNNLPQEYSHLFMAVDGKLSAVILIEDPLRDEATEVVNMLHNLGISRIVMMTGDNEKTAKAVASKVGVDEYYAEVLPEDKADFIKREHEKGRKVIMVGDGINDSPALSESDAGIAISDGAAIAREVSDITVEADDLYALLTLKILSDKMMKRIRRNYRFIVGFNFSLIAFGIAGIIQPTTAALLHNVSTVGISIGGTKSLLKESSVPKCTEITE